MAKDIDFYGPHLKTERAKQHIRELESVFARYVRENKKALRPNRYRQMRERGAPIGAAFPKHTPTILGDALHNLRAALDHAYCVLVEANGGTIDRWTKFPITEKGSRRELEGTINGQRKSGNLPSDKILQAIFDEIQPYNAGKGADLGRLHTLDIADKHMVLLPAEQHTHVEDVRFEDGSSIGGIIIKTSGAPAIKFGPRARLKKDHNHKASFEICFGRGQPFEGEPVLPVINGLAARVDETLQLLERRAKESC